MSTWVDDSLIQSELVGILLLLSLVWLLILKNQLWQSWLRKRYMGTAMELGRVLDMVIQENWRARLVMSGRTGPHTVQVRWSAGIGPHRVTVIVGRRFKKLRWTGPPNTPASEIVERARGLLQRLGA